ncbi:hypothetical protein NEMBOFW57_002622 [Staphylotrichum longicolle]|uniref:WLM domain-containing protein n=1 Tax=Staphylotrichum longicolle TaxID=669026 RepID=A0AAD4F3P1_9PEZI|nr:hypothetical protein NEMBOFW57_002622 [Staphylotrichum longicolle]
MPAEIDPVVLSYTHLRGYPFEDEALHLLKRIASLVKPLMRARGWKVRSLAEMYPDQGNLLGLNINKGEQILLRLRESSDRKQFLPFGKIADTMLHELAHIVHGPHELPFHNLWDQLRDELERLMMKGYTGEGFLGNGQRLGGFNIPAHESRRLARVEAERRKKAQEAQGHRLDGRPPRPGQGIREGFIESLERQSKMALGCATLFSTEREIQEITRNSARNGFRTQAEEDAANEAAIAQALWELVQEDKRKYGGFSWSASYGHFADLIRSAERTPPEPQSPAGEGSYWACLSCTFHNSNSAQFCDMCEEPRPQR